MVRAVSREEVNWRSTRERDGQRVAAREDDGEHVREEREVLEQRARVEEHEDGRVAAVGGARARGPVGGGARGAQRVADLGARGGERELVDEVARQRTLEEHRVHGGRVEHQHARQAPEAELAHVASPAHRLEQAHEVAQHRVAAPAKEQPAHAHVALLLRAHSGQSRCSRQEADLHYLRGLAH